MKRLALVIALFLPSCGGIDPPPLDCRTIGCMEPGTECKEQPDGSWRCVPVEPPVPDVPPISMLLRADGGTLVDLDGVPLDFLGAIPCCRNLEENTPAAFVVEGVTKHTGWPIALHPDWRAYAEEKTGGKANFYHARLGPFFASAIAEPEWINVGGPYLLQGGKADLNQWNPGYWDRVREWVLAAGLEGSYVEIDLNDRWWAKQSPDNRPNPMQPQWNIQNYDWRSQVGRATIESGSHIDRWLEKIVLTIGDLSNVVWQDGNEVGLGGYGVEWTRSMRDRIRHWEATHTNNTVHLFGTNSNRDEAEQIVDYIEKHQGGAIPGPIHGRPSLVNEYNPKPAFTPLMMLERFCRAKAVGTYFWYWRHTQTMDQMSATLGAFAGECGLPTDDCPFGTPTAAWMEANNYDCKVQPKREGKKGIGATPHCQRWPDLADGTSYYCQPGLWPERCASGMRSGPVAPDSHPKRVACEKQFLQLDCPYFSFQSNQHMSYDPWISIDDVNQNHPRNVRVCGQGSQETHPSWIKEPYGQKLYIVAGQWSWATAHGNGKVCAEAANGVAKKCMDYVER